jgi:uncharacterized tellurite resistance protein B-like protein
MGRGWDVLAWIGVERPARQPEALDAISRVLDRLDDRRARYLAAFAYLLGRVAQVDLGVSDEERRVMRQMVAEEGQLTSEEADTVVAVALDDVGRFAGTHNLSVTREFDELATPAEKLALLRCLFAVSAADDSVEFREDNEIRRVTCEMRIEHADFVRARAEVRAHLAVLRARR